MSAYTSRDDARSDLFLSGAFYLFGPLVMAILLGFVPLGRIPVVSFALLLIYPVMFTVLVPFLLMRYRGETLADFGLGGGSDPSLSVGILAGLPIVAASLVTGFVATGTPAGGLALFTLDLNPAVVLAVRVLQWVGLLLLALYGTVKARDAFGGNPLSVRDAVMRVGRVVGIAAAVATVLLMLTLVRRFDVVQAVAFIVTPLGVLGAVVFTLQRLGGRGITTLPTVVTPVVLLAIGPFAFTFDALRFVHAAFNAALYAGVGLVVAMLVERTHRGLGVVALALVIGLLTRLGAFGILGV